MATLEPNGKNPEPRKLTYGTAGASSGYQLQPIPFNDGEIRSLVEMKDEFGEKFLKVSVHETASARIIDVRTDIPQRAKFIEYLIRGIRKKQNHLKALHKLPDAVKPGGAS